MQVQGVPSPSLSGRTLFSLSVSAPRAIVSRDMATGLVVLVTVWPAKKHKQLLRSHNSTRPYSTWRTIKVYVQTWPLPLVAPVFSIRCAELCSASDPCCNHCVVHNPHAWWHRWSSCVSLSARPPASHSTFASRRLWVMNDTQLARQMRAPMLADT